MRRLLHALLLVSAVALARGGPGLAAQNSPPPQIYRWKDSRGRLYITTTPPPPGATVIGLPPEKNTKAPDLPKPISRPGPVNVTTLPNQSLSESQRGFWEILAQSLGEAREKGDRQALEAAADSLFQDSFWGNNLWVLPALPVASLLLLMLLGWFLASNMKGLAKVLVMVLFTVLGFAAAQLTLAKFVYKAQAQRLTGNLMLLQLNLGGGKTLSPVHKEELDVRLRALEEGTSPTALPWKFARDAKAMKDWLRQMMVDP